MANKGKYGSMLSSILAIVLLAGGATLPGCGNAGNDQVSSEHPGDVATQNRPNEPLPPEAQRGFETEGFDPALVIVLDKKGNFRPYRGRDTKERNFSGVLPAEIDEVLGITIIRTTNTKYCYKTTAGDEKCVEI
jgi:hypothetical protein